VRTQNTLTGRVVAPWNPAYDVSRVDYNARFAPFFPDYIVYAEAIGDVVRALTWACHHHIEFRIRSGGHSYEAYSLLNRGLVIDVSALNSIHREESTGLWHMGPGATLLDVYQTLWNQAHMTIPGGSCPTVGLSGLTLGGGVGLTSRQFGLSIDALAQVQMVDARGQTLYASRRVHPELFWALRGAGANNFGVITELAFQAFPVSTVSIFAIHWQWARLPGVLQAFQDWADPQGLNRRLTAILTLTSKASGRVSVVGQFLGLKDALGPLLTPLMQIPGRTDYTVQEMSYLEAVRHFAGVASRPSLWLAQGVADHDVFKNTSAYLYEKFSDPAIRALVAALSDTPGPACLVQLGIMGGRIADIAPDATAFYHRKARADLQYQAYWTQPHQARSHIRWVENFRQAMEPWTVGAYVNYCDGSIADWADAYYGNNLSHLLTVKRQWDPGNLFRYPQGLSELTRPDICLRHSRAEFRPVTSSPPCSPHSWSVDTPW